MKMHTKFDENVPDFIVTSKIQVQTTFQQIGKKVRDELVYLLVACGLAVINILKIIEKERKTCNPIAKLVLRYMTGWYFTLFNSLLTAQRVSHCMSLTG